VRTLSTDIDHVKLRDLIKTIDFEPVTILENGEPAIVMMSPGEFERLEVLELVEKQRRVLDEARIRRRLGLGIGAFLILALAIDAIGMAWGDRRPVGAFFEAFVAQGVYFGTILGSFGGAVWAGIKVFEKSKSKSLGWIAGIFLYAVVGTAVFALFSQIPGVGWRIERLVDRDLD
jgi:PHD/YefM family antitoxin component YafN of YafNO toxin-antitoxin module